MKKILALMFALSLSICGCSTKSTIGNGKVDPVEAATIKIAVGAAFNASPQLILPANIVSTELYNILSDETVEVSFIREIVSTKIMKLGLDKYTQQSMLELCDLLEAEIKTQIDINLDPNQKYVVVKDVIKIVMDASKQRLNN